MCQELVRVSEIEASVVIGHGHDRLVERTKDGLVVPFWAADLARAEIRSWYTGERVNWGRAWECAIEDGCGSEGRCPQCLPAVA